MGPGSFHHQLLERLGATPALTTGGPWQELDHEDLLPASPPMPSWSFDPGAATSRPASGRPRLSAPRWVASPSSTSPAVRTGRIVVIDHPLGLLPASSLSEVAEDMAAAFDRWQGSAP
jgi:hypothetical protein